MTEAASGALSETPVTDFLVRSAYEFARGGWIFTGFHWPVLAGCLAHQLHGRPFVQAYEAGALCWGPPERIPTSTTDFPAYTASVGYRGDSLDILVRAGRHFDRAVLDAGTIDLRGRVNSSFVGERDRPRVRLPGGGGAPDVASQARELVWLHGGSDPRRIVERLDTVTACPRPDARVLLHTRWGVLELGDGATWAQRAEVEGTQEFARHLETFGIAVDQVAAVRPVTADERRAAVRLLTLAADRGYVAARSAAAEAMLLEGET